MSWVEMEAGGMLNAAQGQLLSLLPAKAFGKTLWPAGREWSPLPLRVTVGQEGERPGPTPRQPGSPCFHPNFCQAGSWRMALRQWLPAWHSRAVDSAPTAARSPHPPSDWRAAHRSFPPPTSKLVSPRRGHASLCQPPGPVCHALHLAPESLCS